MKIPKNWHEKLKDELSLPYIQELKQFLESEKKAGYAVYPPEDLIFSAFFYTPFDQVKVVIVGQDPYHGEGQAHGLSFSVGEGVNLPPSLKNIYKEISTDLGVSPPSSGFLGSWAKQGVFLLNSTLTVRKGEPKSHHGKGWEKFTDCIINKLIEREDPIVFLLWGKSAEQKVGIIEQSTHHKILTSSHPSPYSAAGFYGCKHFSKANAYLEKWGKQPIDWVLH